MEMSDQPPKQDESEETRRAKVDIGRRLEISHIPPVSAKTGPEATETEVEIAGGTDGCITISLERAIDSGWLRAEFLGTGDSDSIAVRMVASGTAGARVCPVLENALVLQNSDETKRPSNRHAATGNTQPMLMTGPIVSVAAPTQPTGSIPEPERKQWIRWTLEPVSSVSVGAEAGSEAYGVAVAFCLDRSRDSPEVGMSLTLGDAEISKEGVSLILAKSEGQAHDTIQEAIWAVQSGTEDALCDLVYDDEEEYERVRSLLASAALSDVDYPGIRPCLPESEASESAVDHDGRIHAWP
jgi:hypothetical protein